MQNRNIEYKIFLTPIYLNSVAHSLSFILFTDFCFHFFYILFSVFLCSALLALIYRTGWLIANTAPVSSIFPVKAEKRFFEPVLHLIIKYVNVYVKYNPAHAGEFRRSFV